MTSFFLFDNSSFSFLNTYFNMTAYGKFKPRGTLVGSALPNWNIKHYKSVEILSNI